MKCPLLTLTSVNAEGKLNLNAKDCLEEDCAWFHPSTQSCEISRIASNLSTVANALSDLVPKGGD